jgi:hypothetical protein
VSFGFKTHTFSDFSLTQGSTTLAMGGKGSLNSTSNITFNISHVPLGDAINTVTNVRIYRYDNGSPGGGLVYHNYSPGSAESSTITISSGNSLMPTSTGQGYYRIMITASHTDPDGRVYTGYAFTNPIFYN